jgi:response regulator NasT
MSRNQPCWWSSVLTRSRLCVVFSDDDNALNIRRAVQVGVSAYVVDNREINRLRPILEAALARFLQGQELRAELAELKLALTKRKVVDQAKGLLMSRRAMDEPSAYRTMQKMAMDRNLSMAELARRIIAAAEVL